MSAQTSSVPVSVAIPTYGRDEVLVRGGSCCTAASRRNPCAGQNRARASDRSPVQQWHTAGAIRWVRLTEPSQPGALNHGIREATQEIILCLDDDIEVEPSFVGAHAQCYADATVVGVAGQVLQPGQTPRKNYRQATTADPFGDLHFDFSSATATWVRNGMSGNLSFRREAARAIGGFDENFLPPVSYRFDAEFCARLSRAGGRIRFEPTASIATSRGAAAPAPA